MKLAVSNIAWENNELDDHLELLSTLGCHGVEIAPSCIWPEPVNASKEERQQFKAKVNDLGLEIIGLHALLYTHPDLEILGTKESRTKAKDYLIKNFELCRDLGGKTLVFGSPKARRIQGQKWKEAFDITAEFFLQCAKEAANFDVFLCIEPLSEKEADFIQNSQEGADLVNAVNHPNFRLQLDTKAMVDANENIEKAITQNVSLLKHFHVNDPGLSPPGSKGVDHKKIGAILNNAGYNGYVSIEMRRNFGPTKDVVTKSVEYIKQCYAIDAPQMSSIERGMPS